MTGTKPRSTFISSSGHDGTCGRIDLKRTIISFVAGCVVGATGFILYATYN